MSCTSTTAAKYWDKARSSLQDFFRAGLQGSTDAYLRPGTRTSIQYKKVQDEVLRPQEVLFVSL